MKKPSIFIACAVLCATWVGAELPLRHVTLFNSGVAYFERRGTVTEDEDVSLRFRREQVNDVIKSLIVIDHDGGMVSAVTYDAPDPLERTLRSFAVDLSDQPSFPQLLERLRGTSVRAKISARDYEGRIVGVEQQRRKKNDAEWTVSVLNLHTDQGLRPVPLDEVQELEILDPAIARDFQAALDVLAGQMDQTQRSVRLQFVGKGERNVRVAYMLENPVWKASYRVVIDDNDLLLQGWGHVENMTDDDWDNVNVSLVSGRPISFIQNLYDPIYVQRPEVKMELHEEVAPPEYARDMAPLAMAAPAPRARAPAAPQEAMAVTDFAEQEAVAVGEEAGELFQYVVDEPVSVPRQSSAMLPIVQADVKGEALSIYNESVHGRHPLNGVELENTSGLFLMQGPVTVFEGGIYAGDARLPDTQIGESRLLGYAVDLATEVALDWERAPQEIVQLKVIRGVLHAHREQRETATYRIHSTRDRERALLIEHPVKPGWDLLEPEEEPTRTKDRYRFRLKLGPEESRRFTVTQRRIQEQTVALRSLDSDRIEYYLRQQVIAPRLKEAMEELAARQSALSELRRRREDLEKTIADITKEQERIRQNMSVVQRPSDSFSMWERKLIEQEEELERLNARLREVRKEEAEKRRAMEEWLMQLTIE